MNKPLIYNYIEQIEQALKPILSDNHHADIIIHEIISNALMLVHDADNSCLTNEETAQGAVRMSINSFYEAGNIVKVVDKYNNPHNRIFYGLRARYVYSTENLLKSIDILKKDVRKERDCLLKTVDSINLTFHEKSRKPYKYGAVIAIAITTVVLILSVPYFQNKSNGEKIEGKYVYVDRMHILHSNRKCSRLNYKGMTCDRIKREELWSESYKSICPKCVDDKMYETLTNNQNDY